MKTTSSAVLYTTPCNITNICKIYLIFYFLYTAIFTDISQPVVKDLDYSRSILSPANQTFRSSWNNFPKYHNKSSFLFYTQHTFFHSIIYTHGVCMSYFNVLICMAGNTSKTRDDMQVEKWHCMSSTYWGAYYAVSSRTSSKTNIFKKITFWHQYNICTWIIQCA